jgi:tetratricopeptide (TPR) repeat protein
VISIERAQQHSWTLLLLLLASSSHGQTKSHHGPGASARHSSPNVDRKSPAPTAPARDELQEHVKAAQTYQIAQDWPAAERENRSAAALALRRIGDLDLRANKLEEAEAHLRESLAMKDDPAAHTDLSILLMRQRKVDPALEQVNAALAQDDNNGRAHHMAGKLEYMRGHYGEAVAHLEKAVVMAPDPEAAYTLGMSYLKQRNLQRASMLFEEMEIAAKDKAGAHVLFARAYRDTDYIEQSIEHLKRAIAINPDAPRVHFFLGLAYLLEHDMAVFPQAREQFAEEARRHPQDYNSHYFMGMISAMQKDYAAATPELLKATSIKGSDPDPWLYLGQAQFETGDNAAALLNLRKAVELTKDVSRNSYQIQRAHFMLSRIYSRLGQKDEAAKEVALSADLRKQSLANSREVIGEIVNPSQDLAAAIRSAAEQTSKTDSEAADELLSPQEEPVIKEEAAITSLRQKLSASIADAYNNLGVISARADDVPSAIQHLTAAVKWNPSLAGANRNLGILAFKSQDYEHAVPALQAALRAKSDDMLVRRMLGMAQYLRSDFAPAAETLQPIAASLYPDPVLVSAYGNSLARSQRLEEARAVFVKVAADNPSSAEAQLAAAKGFSAADSYEEALKYFHNALLLRPNLLQAHYGAGQCLIRLHRLPEAAAEFRKELELDPSEASARYHLAYVLLESQQKDEARKILESLVQEKPEYANAQYQLGKLLLDAGELKDAIPHLESATQTDPDRDYSHYQLSIAYRKDGRAEEAERELKAYQQIKATQRNRPIPGMQEPVSGASPSN